MSPHRHVWVHVSTEWVAHQNPKGCEACTVAREAGNLGDRTLPYRGSQIAVRAANSLRWRLLPALASVQPVPLLLVPRSLQANLLIAREVVE